MCGRVKSAKENQDKALCRGYDAWGFILPGAVEEGDQQ
jgi:hypothetical protein